MAYAEAPSTVVAAAAVGATKIYGSGDTQVVALDHVSAEFQRGQFTAIMGPSGSGKSTLMHCLAGLDRLTEGSVFIGGVDLSTLDEKGLTQLRRDQIGFIFQAFNLIPTLSAIENITLPMDLGNRAPDQTWVDQVVTEQPSEVDRYRAGETRLLAFLMGQVMKKSRGKADPKAVSELLQRQLEAL